MIGHACKVTYDKKDKTLVYRLGKKSDDNSRIRPTLAKFANPPVKTNLIRNTFKLKDSMYSISNDRTKSASYIQDVTEKEKRVCR